NDPPTLDPLSDLVILEDSGITVVTLSGISSGASNEVENIQITATSDQLGVIGPPSVAYQSPGTNGTLTLVPLPNASGEALITVTVSDGELTNHLFQRTFRVQVTPVPDPPILSSI